MSQAVTLNSSKAVWNPSCAITKSQKQFVVSLKEVFTFYLKPDESFVASNVCKSWNLINFTFHDPKLAPSNQARPLAKDTYTSNEALRSRLLELFKTAEREKLGELCGIRINADMRGICPYTLNVIFRISELPEDYARKPPEFSRENGIENCAQHMRSACTEIFKLTITDPANFSVESSKKSCRAASEIVLSGQEIEWRWCKRIERSEKFLIELRADSPNETLLNFFAAAFASYAGKLRAEILYSNSYREKVRDVSKKEGKERKE